MYVEVALIFLTQTHMSKYLNLNYPSIAQLMFGEPEPEAAVRRPASAPASAPSSSGKLTKTSIKKDKNCNNDNNNKDSKSSKKKK